MSEVKKSINDLQRKVTFDTTNKYNEGVYGYYNYIANLGRKAFGDCFLETVKGVYQNIYKGNSADYVGGYGDSLDRNSYNDIMYKTFEDGGFNGKSQQEIDLINMLETKSKYIWFDVNDISTMYQDREGTIPVDSLNQEVYRIDSKGNIPISLIVPIGSNPPIVSKNPDDDNLYLLFDYMALGQSEMIGTHTGIEPLESFNGTNLSYFVGFIALNQYPYRRVPLLEVKTDSTTLLNISSTKGIRLDVQNNITSFFGNTSPIKINLFRRLQITSDTIVNTLNGSSQKSLDNFSIPFNNNITLRVGMNSLYPTECSNGMFYGCILINDTLLPSESYVIENFYNYKMNYENYLNSLLSSDYVFELNNILTSKKSLHISMDYRNMYQFFMKTTPVTAINQPVGAVLSTEDPNIYYFQRTSSSRPLFKIDDEGRPCLYSDGVDDFIEAGYTPSPPVDLTTSNYSAKFTMCMLLANTVNKAIWSHGSYVNLINSRTTDLYLQEHSAILIKITRPTNASIVPFIIGGYTDLELGVVYLNDSLTETTTVLASDTIRTFSGTATPQFARAKGYHYGYTVFSENLISSEIDVLENYYKVLRGYLL